MTEFWVKGANPDEPEQGISMIDAITRLRDEISVIGVRGHGYGSRNLSMVLTKLDEARLWATEYAINERNTHLLVDKAQYREALDRTTATDTTDTTDRKQ